ncbi:MAG: hypothetical protein IJC43_02965 [Clostridia bacterium]|nr:hypothetical protein [Clostridia bacterium]
MTSYTAPLCQRALAKELEQLFEGRRFCGQQSKKPLKVFLQDLPIPADDDADADTDAAVAPCLVLRMAQGEIADMVSPEEVVFSITVCAFDEGREREGFFDVLNIIEAIKQRFGSAPYFGGAYTVLPQMSWAMQQDDTHPYYYGAMALVCTVPVMTGESALKELI